MLLIILVQDFCPLQIKITQCPGGFRLKVLGSQTAKRNNGYSMLPSIRTLQFNIAITFLC